MMPLPWRFGKAYLNRMTSLEDSVAQFLELLGTGQTVRAIEQFYDDEIVVFENRALARAGKQQCLEFERSQLASQPETPKFKLHAHAVNLQTHRVFLEYTVRFAGPDGRPLRLDEVTVQRWDGAKITEERFYYEGVVDEGDTPR